MTWSVNAIAGFRAYPLATLELFEVNPGLSYVGHEW